ncbi:cysteine/Histidine-rich C1 domain family protein [Striga asiatica]|uniref:Cysteine/Histidine-rich C1 domain family protein n=1 Tax=Striga asiatica TaxID=4170 RepID=A0A5A7RD54_STRAF|nr:cysteine/Histidine-rich C1 domain family protein [Striga asiatica]
MAPERSQPSIVRREKPIENRKIGRIGPLPAFPTRSRENDRRSRDETRSRCLRLDRVLEQSALRRPIPTSDESIDRDRFSLVAARGCDGSGSAPASDADRWRIKPDGRGLPASDADQWRIKPDGRGLPTSAAAAASRSEICAMTDGSDPSGSTTGDRHSGQLARAANHRSMHGTWNTCAHPGTSRTRSSSFRSPRHTAHSPSAPAFTRRAAEKDPLVDSGCGRVRNSGSGLAAASPEAVLDEEHVVEYDCGGGGCYADNGDEKGTDKRVCIAALWVRRRSYRVHRNIVVSPAN